MWEAMKEAWYGLHPRFVPLKPNNCIENDLMRSSMLTTACYCPVLQPTLASPVPAGPRT